MSKQKDLNNIPDDEATKPPKPKKAFEVVVTVWDDGEIATKCSEFIKKERGAPEKWLRKPAEFNAAIKSKVSDNPVVLIEHIAEGMGVHLSELLSKKA
jgi:hypothetical protein